MKPLVSIIIPTRNREKLLERALKSVLAQTYPNFECLVIDDASSDNTGNLVKSFTDKRIRYIYNENHTNASAARNIGLRISGGEFIAFLDDDDEWFPAKLEKQVNLFLSLPPGIGMVYTWMDYYDSAGKVITRHHPVLKGYVFPHVLDEQRLGGCPTLMVRRKVVEAVGGFDENLPRGNDGDFIRRVCLSYDVEYIPEVLVKVHVGHYDRITAKFDKEGIARIITAQKIKLVKFENELSRYPEQKANILASIAYYYSLLPDWSNSLKFYIRSFTRYPFTRKFYTSVYHSLIETIRASRIR